MAFTPKTTKQRKWKSARRISYSINGRFLSSSYLGLAMILHVCSANCCGRRHFSSSGGSFFLREDLNLARRIPTLVAVQKNSTLILSRNVSVGNG